MVEDRLDLGIQQSQRVLDQQLSGVDQLQTKIGVLLGFNATLLAVIFSIGHAWLLSHPAVAWASGGTLLASMAIFAASLALEDYTISPRPDWLVAMLNDSGKSLTDLKEELIGNFAGAYDENKRLINQRFALINLAIVLMLLGLAVFVIGALLS
ncbi:MAG TPA: hypothetical protein VFG07_03755 [Thermoplasmata archaeon]|nr:hypothetical protein [Thermoplasmata archaeon]